MTTQHRGGNLYRRVDALAAHLGSQAPSAYAPAWVSVARCVGDGRQAEVDALVRAVCAEARDRREGPYVLRIWLHPDGGLVADTRWRRGRSGESARIYAAEQHSNTLDVDLLYQEWLATATAAVGASADDLTAEDTAAARDLFMQDLREYLKAQRHEIDAWAASQPW